jgi:broad-specificity NMP kinase
MIIILTGPTGSGKTDTSWELLKVFNNIVFLDCDWFASMQPFSWDKKSDVAMVYELLAQMMDYHLLHGKKRFVVTLTGQMAALYSEYQNLFISKKLPIYLFWLRCSDQNLIERIDLRSHVNKKQQEQKALRQQQFFDKMFLNNSLFMLVDTANLNESEVVRKVRNMINSYDKLQADAKK